MTDNKIRILIVDDSSFVRFQLTATLNEEADFEVVGSTDDFESTLQAIEAVQPDVVLMDVEMPTGNGLDFAEVIKKSWPNVRVVMVSAHTGSEHLERAFRIGADGYCPKGLPLDQIKMAVTASMEGVFWSAPSVADRALGILRRFGAAECPQEELTRKIFSFPFKARDPLHG